MKTYRIKYNYSTGNSFGSHDAEDVLDFSWENLEIVKENLKRINDHYLWYSDKQSYSNRRNSERPIWHEGLSDFVLKLKMDNGNEVQFCADWCGYFETLYSAEIVCSENNDRKITF